MLFGVPSNWRVTFFCGHRTGISTVRFDKPAKSISEQLALLRERGMVVDDTLTARHSLAHLNYYRLTAYWLPFEASHAPHAFRQGTRFEDVLNLYLFDRTLRLLVLDAIARTEISLRTQWAYHLAHRHGPHAYLDRNLARRGDWWQHNLDRLREEVERSDEVFVKHYRRKYDQPDLPPVWVVCEIMTLGTLSRWYTNLKPKQTRSAIARTYVLDERVLQAFIRHLSYIRNVCAHHGRLWNRQFTVTMQLPRSKPTGLVASFHDGGNRRLYNTLVMLAWMLDRIHPGNKWKIRLLDLIRQHGIDPADMGFPADYVARAIWQPAQADAP
jgi:abortive infection bacteriophage resistance protein